VDKQVSGKVTNDGGVKRCCRAGKKKHPAKKKGEIFEGLANIENGKRVGEIESLVPEVGTIGRMWDGTKRESWFNREKNF